VNKEKKQEGQRTKYIFFKIPRMGAGEKGDHIHDVGILTWSPVVVPDKNGGGVGFEKNTSSASILWQNVRYVNLIAGPRGGEKGEKTEVSDPARW